MGADNEAVAGIVALLAAPAGTVPYLNRDVPLVEDASAVRAAELVPERILVAGPAIVILHMPVAPPHRHDLLYPVVLLAADDGCVMVLDIETGDLGAVVLHDFVAQVVFRQELLQEDVAGVAFVEYYHAWEHPFSRLRAPCVRCIITLGSTHYI